MPSAFTHAVAGLALTELVPLPCKPAWMWIASACLAAAPDLDVLTLAWNVPYHSFFGHRGFFHSLLFSAVVGTGIGLVAQMALGGTTWQWTGFFALVLASHGILDCFTNGGLGVALLSPFTTHRLFFPWRPIQVAPIGVAAFFSRRGLLVMRSEIAWVWLPAALLVAAVLLWPRV